MRFGPIADAADARILDRSRYPRELALCRQSHGNDETLCPSRGLSGVVTLDEPPEALQGSGRFLGFRRLRGLVGLTARAIGGSWSDRRNVFLFLGHQVTSTSASAFSDFSPPRCKRSLSPVSVV